MQRNMQSGKLDASIFVGPLRQARFQNEKLKKALRKSERKVKAYADMLA